MKVWMEWMPVARLSGQAILKARVWYVAVVWNLVKLNLLVWAVIGLVTAGKVIA